MRKSSRQTAAYIAAVTEELATLAKAQKLKPLAFLLSMAALEARSVALEETQNAAA